MHDTVTHPLFQYKINYRRTLDLEVRLLARFLEGELSEYRPFMIR
jgi:CRISP-associated protein Cas1